MGLVTCVAAGKGGIGNTTVSGNLALALGKLGFRTLLIDTDPDDTTLSLMFGGSIGILSIKDYLSKKTSLMDVATSAKHSGVDVVKVGPFPTEDPDVFPEFLSHIREDYDVILIDVPPGLGENVKLTVASSDRVLLVTNPNVPSVIFTLKIKWLAEELRRRPMGVVVNKKGTKYDVPSEYIKDLLGLEILGEVTQDSEVMESLQKNRPLQEVYPESSAAKGIEKLAERLKRI